MKDFIKNYTKGTVSPLTLLLTFANDRDDVIKTILNTESLKGIYDVPMFDRICKSLCNEGLKEEGYGHIRANLIKVAVTYIETHRETAIENDSTLLTKLNGMDCKLDDYSGPDEIIKKMENNGVLKEYLPEAIRVVGLDIKTIFEQDELHYVTSRDVEVITAEFIAFATISRNIRSILEDNDSIDERLKERHENVASKVKDIFEARLGFVASECQHENFISLTDRIRDMHGIIRNTHDALNNIKAKDIFDFKVSASDILIKLTSGEIDDKDVYVFEQALILNDNENEVYSKLAEKVTSDLVKFNKIHALTDEVLKKIDL